MGLTVVNQYLHEDDELIAEMGAKQRVRLYIYGILLNRIMHFNERWQSTLQKLLKR